MRKNHRNFRAFPAPDTNTDTGRLYGATSPDRPEREAGGAPGGAGGGGGRVAPPPPREGTG